MVGWAEISCEAQVPMLNAFDRRIRYTLSPNRLSRTVVGPALILAFLASSCPSSAAPSLPTLDSDNYWVIVGSRQNIDDAISIARQHGDDSAQVVGSVNGWFAVVEGPKKVLQGAGKTFLDSLIKSGAAPKDAYLTRGTGLTDVVWKPSPSPVLQTLQYDGKAPVELTQSGIKISVDRKGPDSDGDFFPFAKGYKEGKELFTLSADKNPSEDPSATLYALWLDQASSAPQIVLTYYWHGAHCCTVTRIANLKPDGRWAVTETEDLDGDGYDFEDINRDGSIQLISSDNSFLYAFDSYADSVAPLKIQSFKDGALHDVTKLPIYQHRLWQRLFSIERFHQEESSDTDSNGFLAGWVASKILVGQGDQAWQSMLKRYDHHPNMGPEVCLTGAPLSNCPANKTAKVPFPVALRGFLLEHGYIQDASQYPIPVDDTKFVIPEVSQHDPEPSEPSQPLVPTVNSNMRACADSSDTVKTIIYQMFAGRKMLASENDAMVTLEDDTTVEAADSGIGKVICAVTYDLNLKRMIGQLAEVGDMRRAAALNIMSRRAGAEVSRRIKYSVKPTAQGKSFVEVLP